MALALREEYTHTSLRARHHRRYTSDTHPCRCHAALYGHHASRPPTMPGKHGVPHDRKRHTLSNIPPERLECNYIGGTGRCGGGFRLTSLQIQGSEDFCFGYQAVTKKWCSQLFRNRLIGCFYSKNYLFSKAQRSEMAFPNGKRVCTPKSLSRLMAVKTTLNKSDSLRPNRLITNLHKGRGASRKACSPFFLGYCRYFSPYMPVKC